MKRRIILVLSILAILGGLGGGIYWWRQRTGQSRLLTRAEMALDQAHEPKRAVELAQSFINQQPSDWRGYYVLARALSQLSQHEQARAELQKAMKLKVDEPAMLKLVLAMGRTYRYEASQVQDIASSKDAAQRALDLLAKEDPDQRALDLIAKGDEVLAQQKFKDAADLDVREDRGLLCLQACEVHRQRIEKLTEQEAALKADDQQLDAQKQQLEKVKAQLDAQKQQLEKVKAQAVDTLVDVVREDPKRDGSMVRLLEMCQHGDWQEELAKIDKAIVKLNDPPPGTAAMLAIWRLEKAGLSRQGIEQTRKYIQERQLQHPDSTELRIALIHLALRLVEQPMTQQDKLAEVDKALQECEALAKGKLSKDRELRVRLLRALLLLAKDLPAQAEGDLMALKTRYPNVEVQCAYARAAQMLGKHEAAAEAMREVTKLDPLNVQARKYLAEQLLLQGHFNQAFEDAGYLYKASPKNPKAVGIYVQAARQTGQPNLARQVLEKAFKDGQDDPEMLWQVCLGYKDMKEEQHTREAAQAAAQCKPTNLAQREAVARALATINKRPEAEAMLKAAVADEPRSTQPLMALARFYSESGWMTQTIDCSKKLLELDARNVIALRLLANGYYAIGMLEESLSQLEELLRQDPADSEAQVMAGHVREMLGEPVDWQQAVAHLDPQRRSKLPLAQAYVQLRLGKPDKALKICQDELKRVADFKLPADLELLGLAGMACEALGQVDECAKHWSAVLDEQPDSLPNYYRLGKVWARQGGIGSLPAKFAGTRRARPELVEMTMGWLYERIGDPAKAQQSYRRAAGTVGAAPAIREQAQFFAALAAGAAGDLPKALAELDKLTANATANAELQKQALVGKVRLLINNRRFAETDAPLTALKALAIKQSDAGLLSQVAAGYAKCQRLEKALAICGEAEAMRPNAPEPLMMRGQLLISAGKPEEAVEPFRKAVQLQSSNLSYWRALRSALEVSGQAGAAMGVLAEAEKQGSIGKTFAALERGAMLGRWGLPEQAIAAYQQLDASALASPGFELALGQAYAHLGQAQDARKHLENVPAATPEYVEARLLLAEMAEKPQDKVAELNKLLATRPHDPNLLAQVMGLLMRMKLSPEALKIYQGSVQKLPPDALLAVQPAGLAINAALASGEYKTAADLSARLAKETGLPQYRHLAVLLMLDDRPDEAAMLLPEPDKATFLDCVNGILLAARKGNAQRGPQSPNTAIGDPAFKPWAGQLKVIEARLAKADSAQTQNAAPGAANPPAQLDPVVRLLAWTAVGASQEAQAVLAELKNRNDAENRAIDSLLEGPAPQQEAQKLLQALACVELGAVELGRQQAMKLLQDRPTCGAAAAVVLISQPDLPTREKLLAILQPPDCPLAQSLQANLLLQKGKFAEAAQAYEAMLSKGKLNPGWLRAQGIALEQAGKLTEALKVYRRLWETSKDHGAANSIAYLLTQLSPKDKAALDEAAKLIQTALEADPNSAEMHDTAGWVAYLQDRPAEACRSLMQAVRALPGSPDVHYHLGMALAASGQRDLAKQHLQAAVKLAKQAPPTRPALNELARQAQEALEALEDLDKP